MRRMMSGSSCSRALLSLALLVVITALVVGLENDDLVFDHEDKSPIADSLKEQDNHESLFHKIWNWLSFKTDVSSLTRFKSPGHLKNSIDGNDIGITNVRRKRDIDDVNRINNDDSSVKLRKSDYKDESTIQLKFPQNHHQGDDEDDTGSGESEGESDAEDSANTVEYRTTRPVMLFNYSTSSESNFVDEPDEFKEKNIYRMSMIINEPYREEFKNRDDEVYKKFAERLTKTVEEILQGNLRKEKFHVTFVKIDNAPDAFQSHVDLDIHTMSSELEVRDTLERQINTFYSLGKFTVDPNSFRLRAVLGCQPGEITCDVSRCILQSQRCDFKVHCEDGSDEANCKYPTCASDDFVCKNGQCIKSSLYCNNQVDCSDNSDEMNCLTTCGAHEYRCLEGICISIDKRCNGYADCRNGDDEDSCDQEATFVPNNNYSACNIDQFQCSPHFCINRIYVCNGVIDCPDGSDERNCFVHERNEEMNKRLNIKIYPKDQVIKENSEVVFQCRDEGPLRAKVRWFRDNKQTLPPNSRTDNNGRLEIPNIRLEHSGIYICEAENYSYLPEYQVAAQLTVEKVDHSWFTSLKMCNQNESTCSNQECILKNYVCDGKIDCSDGSDEIRCGHHGCEPNEFRCTNKQCVTKIWRCDGDKDCTDGSDEENCSSSSQNYPCNYGEFKCSTNNQCIPKTYQCDHDNDCFDGSDEIGCSPVFIVKPPPPMMILDPGDTLSLTCTAIAVPIPEVNWRFNWGHIPQKCSTTSVNGTGTLDCPDIRIEDQGAYSCEGINVMGFVVAVPDTTLIVRNTSVCPLGQFNSEARKLEECISCFCFGVAAECSSANLFTYQIPLPVNRYRIVPVDTTLIMKVHSEINSTEVVPINGFYHLLLNDIKENVVTYFGLPEHFNGNQLKSYGGYLHYDVKYNGNAINNKAPSVIIIGNDLVIIHHGLPIFPNQNSKQKIRLMYGEWFKYDVRGSTLASREEIMMVLANVNDILIKAQYEDVPQLNISITNVMLDSARSVGSDSAPFVEECRCPSGYTGLSCENCASGYTRRKNGRWLGQCYKENHVPPTCPRTFYGDPSRGVPCQPCPCPLPNKFDRTCHLDFASARPICDCPPGYKGKQCEMCAEGYHGNPLQGEECISYEQCDHSGSLSIKPDPYTGRCQCKEYVTGSKCNQCKPNTFSLTSNNQFGCISCFCMGITRNCVASNWYRNEIRVSFGNSPHGFSLISSNDHDSAEVISDIHVKFDTREIAFNNFPDRGTGDVYYWQLPEIFLGNRITAYGGNLRYVARYIPSPGGLTSRNSAANVELISSNDITLLYYSHGFPEPNVAKTFNVPIFEQYWQRADGTKADREHLLMALADIKAIRIKATYTTHTYEAALSFVSLDISEEFNTGKTRAIEVEKCNCPSGYQGLSCEDCAVGYTRAIDGLYLGICEPCRCNGHSNYCHSDTGVCQNCAHHTTGENCEVCDTGYEGDATRGTPHDCQPKNDTSIQCNCNPAGSISRNCSNGQCYCKRNVEGVECDRCRYGTFGLSSSNPDGCSECFCSGTTQECHESSLYIQQIPIFLINNIQHGFILTDFSRREVISNKFEVNDSINEIGYQFSDDKNKRLFWSLPNIFTGNKIKSYGGNLSFTQRIITTMNSVCHKDQDIILIGKGLTLYWTHLENITPNSTRIYSVPLKESEWRYLSSSGLRISTRSDLMTVLANLDAILVRASRCNEMIATYISDISLDTAGETVNNGMLSYATQVEVCRCPAGYSGTSCESCTPGYYRNLNDRSINVLGSCNPCPCNGNEQSCELDWSGHVKCLCHSQFTGKYCQDAADFTQLPTTTSPTTSQSSLINVEIREPKIQIVKIGDSIRYHCSAKSLYNDPVTVTWEKEDGYLPPGRSIDDSAGVLFIREVRVSDSGNYICRATDGVHITTEKTTLHVGDMKTDPIITIRPPYLKIDEGKSAEFTCKTSEPSESIIEWVRENGKMNPNATFAGGILKIPSVSIYDAAEYKCIVRSSTGSSERSVQLHVTAENPLEPDIKLFISPLKWSGFSGDTVKFTCNTSRPVQKIVWSRTDRLLLPAAATQNNGVLTILNPSLNDAGWYICTATLYDGTEKSTTTSISINPRYNMPMISVTPQRQKVPQGSSATIQCKTEDDEFNIKWIKNRDSNLGSNVQAAGNTLHIMNAQVSNRGIYTCRINLDGKGAYEASAIVEIEPREMPTLQIHPKDTQIVLEGGTADFHCRAITGIPTPVINWSRQDNKPLGSNSQTIGGGMLRINNVTIADEGSYVCIAQNSVGVTSASVTLEVHSLPKINITPQNGILRLKLGDKLHLICSASGYPQPTVSWTKDYSTQPVIDPFRSVAFGPSATIDINTVSKEDEGNYICRASSTAGVIEDYVQLRIEDDVNSIDYPEMCRGDISCFDSSQEKSNKHNGLLVDRISNVPSGSEISIRCQLYPSSDDKNIFLDWKREDGRLLPSDSTINDGTLIIHNLKKEDSGDYICFGIDIYGNEVFSAKTQLTVIDLPKIELRPTKQTVRPGDSPSIHCIASGAKPLNVQWEAVGRSLPSSVNQANDVLQFSGITFADAGKYVCKAWNNYGTAESVAEVSVEALASPIVKIHASKNPVNIGDSVDLHCATSGVINPHYVWSKPYEITLPANARQTGNILSIININSMNGGIYRCEVDSNDGIIESDITLHIKDEESSTEKLDNKFSDIKYVSFGQSINLECRDHLQPPVTYQWTKINGSLSSKYRTYEHILSLDRVDRDDVGIYSCKAKNGKNVRETFTTVIVTGLVPYFNQVPLSFIELPPLTDVFLTFDIEISFRLENSDGILLYTSENFNGYGDFVSLSFENGFPIFRFDLGSGPTVIKAEQNITLGEWHTISIKRNHKDGIMIVDDTYSYKAVSRGKKDGLDVPNPLYVGGVAENIIINDNVGSNIGFVGCVNRLTIGGKEINLMHNMMMSQSISNCEICERLENICIHGACQESTAKNGYECLCNIGYTGNNCESVKQHCQQGICGDDGICNETDNGYTCDCPIGKSGPNCEYLQMIRTPKLTDPRSYLAYPRPKTLRRNG